MYYPTVGERVRVSGRVEGYSVISADYTSFIAEIRLDLDGTAVYESERVSFNMLLHPTHVTRLALAKGILRTAEGHINSSAVLIADMQDSICKTFQAIRTSHQLICNSDHIVAQCWGFRDCE